jgi:hypothetical protein
VEKPAAVIPIGAGGFTVSVYAELAGAAHDGLRANGDLFVSSPAANNITVLRDANNDGVFESRGVYAQGEVARRGGGAAAEPRAVPRLPRCISSSARSSGRREP